jgi:peptide/nickel transport system ATP-binding protein
VKCCGHRVKLYKVTMGGAQLWTPAKTISQSRATPVISLQNVTAAYGKNDPVVRDVSFDIHAGRTVAVVGESGSGKSTAARCITGLLPPLSGSISFNGTPLPADYRNRSNDQLRQIQMIYQMADTALNPRRKIGEIIGRPVEFYLGLKGQEKRRRVEELLAQIELEPTNSSTVTRQKFPAGRNSVSALPGPWLRSQNLSFVMR